MVDYSKKSYSKDTNDILRSKVKPNLDKVAPLTEKQLNDAKCELLSVFAKDRH